MSNILDKTLGELIESGADIYVSYHRAKNLADAYKMLGPYKEVSPIYRKSHNGVHWAGVKEGSLEISAFYGDK